MESFESGAVREEVGMNGVLAAREAVGRRKELSALGTDLVRWKVGARWVVRKDGVAKSFYDEVSGILWRVMGSVYLDIGVPFAEDVNRRFFL